MAIRNFAKCLALAVLASACTVKEQMNPQAPTPSEPEVSEEIPGKATVEFSDELLALIEGQLDAGEVKTKSAALNVVLEELGIVSLRRVFPYAGEYEGRTRRSGLHRFYRVTYATGVSSTKAVMDLSSVPGVISVTPAHRLYKRTVSFDDPQFSQQWHYINKSTPGVDINVQGVWESYTKGDPRVVVSVIDEPVDASCPDLAANLWKDAQGHTGYNFARGNLSYSATDPGWDLSIRPEGGKEKYNGKWEYYNGDIGHGTHVAGTISAVNNNGLAVCGIAGGDYANGIPGVRVQSCAIFSGWDGYAEDEAAAAAMKWGVDHGAVISQNSWGPSKVSTPIAQYDPMMKAAIDYFIEYAGCYDNGEQRPDSPMKGGLVFFAAGNDAYNYDPYGAYEPVISVGATGATGKGSSYSNYGSWVDIAAPGGDDYDDIYSTLPAAINDYGYNGGSVVSTPGYGGMQGTSMACPHASGVAALIISYFGGPGFTAEDARRILNGGLGATVSVVNKSSRKVGKKLDALASFQWALANGYTAGGGGSVDPPVVQRPPVVELSQTNITVKAHESVEVTYTVSDPDGDPVTVTCETGSIALKHDASAQKLTIDGWKANPGTYTATVTASDGTLEGSATLKYTLLQNHAPKAKGELGEFLLNGLDDVKSFKVDALFEDEDGETPTLSAKADDPCVYVGMAAGRLTVSPRSYGIANVTITASDFLGADASISFRVAVVNPDQPVQLVEEVVSSELELRIETATPTAVKLAIYASTGGLVYKKETLASAFLPIQLNVAGLAPGRYTAELTYNDVTHRVRFIKY